MVDHALTAARALEEPAAEAWALHQQGSRAMCLGDRVLALDALEHALELRERLGDAEGAATTRHNLAQLGGGAAPPPHDGRPTPPQRPRWPWLAGGVLGVVAAGVAAAVLASSGGSSQPAPATAESTAPTATRNAPTDTTGGPQGNPSTPITTDGGGTPRPVPATVTPGKLPFDVQAVETTSDPKSIDVANTSSAPATIGAVTTAGENAADFVVDARECADRTLDPGTSCAVSVMFAPTANGPRTAAVTFADLGDGSSGSVELTGTGCVPRKTCPATEPAHSAGTSVPESSTPEQSSPPDNGTPPADATKSAPIEKQPPTEDNNG
jgi:hypothetical protein